MKAHIDIPRDELSVVFSHRADMVERAALKASWNFIRRWGFESLKIVEIRKTEN